MNEELTQLILSTKNERLYQPLPTKTEQHSQLFEADLLGAWEKVWMYSLMVVVGGFVLGSFLFFFCIVVLNFFL